MGEGGGMYEGFKNKRRKSDFAADAKIDPKFRSALNAPGNFFAGLR